MPAIPLGRSTWGRRYLHEPDVFVTNRYFEQTPTNQVDNFSMALRPGLRRRTFIGDGPIRAIWQSDGFASGDSWVVSGQKLFRVHKSNDVTIPDVVTMITGFVAGTETPYITAAQVTGGTPFLWVADGETLQYWTDVDMAATGTLTFNEQPADGDTFTIGAVTYTFKNAPGGGTDIQIAPDLPQSIANAVTSITTNSSADVTVTASDDFSLTVTDVTPGVAGNLVPTTSVSDAMFWGGSSLSGGTAANALAVCAMPDDVSPTSLDFIKGFVIVTVGDPFLRRFYWIEPGDNTVDPLNFAEKESVLDLLLNVKAVSDQFWLFGTESTEAWYVTGDPAAPMAPISGRPYNRGVWEGTPIKVNDSVILIGSDGRVYDVTAGPNPISYPGIEERIKRAMVQQNTGT